MTRLHVTNGDAALERIEGTGLPGQLLSWLDVLHEGPVPALPPSRLRVVRAQFIGERGWDDVDVALAALARRDAVIERAHEYEEVVLWFEHDLFDQLQLLEVLSRLAEAAGREAAVSLAQADRYLGEMDAGSLSALFDQRRPVTAATYAVARDAWAAFTSTDPRRLAPAVSRASSHLPFLATALHRLCEEFPAPRTGLSRSERRALEAFAVRPCTIGEAFRRSREEPAFVGDSVFAWYLERLSGDRAALVSLEDGAPIRAPRGAGTDAVTFWSKRAALTDHGRAVLDGRADAVRLRGVDRWIGGVHLAPDVGIWRWDAVDGFTVDGDPAALP